jgi:drug/metabolite transporter (DMT)-like permease
VRFIYESTAPPSPAQLSAVRTLISLAPFAGALSRLLAARDEEEEDGRAGGEATADDADDAPIAADVAETAAPSLLRAGVELGVLNCVGTAAQAYGLEQTTSTRAGFLLATINVLVPVGSYLSGETVSPAVWAACALAALGVGVVSDALPVPIHWSDHDQTRAGAALDSIDPSIDSIAAAGLNAGDAYVLIAAVAYAAFTVRLGKFASAADASELAAVKTAVMGALFVAWALIEAAVAVTGGGGGGELGDVSGTLTRGVLWSPAGVGFVAAWAAVAYSALAPGALATYLQTKGQSVVPAAEAQVIFATTPVFNALVSCVFLGEAIGADVAAGGGILVLASALPAAAEWRESRDRRRP